MNLSLQHLSRVIDLSIFVISCCSGCRSVRTSAYSTTCRSWGLSRVIDLSLFVISCCNSCRNVRTSAYSNSAWSLSYQYCYLLLQRLPEYENLSLQYLSRVIDLSIFVISCCSGCRSVRTWAYSTTCWALSSGFHATSFSWETTYRSCPTPLLIAPTRKVSPQTIEEVRAASKSPH